MAVIKAFITLRQQAALVAVDKPCFVETEQRGQVGDTLQVLGVEFRIRGVGFVKLDDVAERYYRNAGVTSPEEFRLVWRELHARTGYRPHQLVRVHWIEPVEATAKVQG